MRTPSADLTEINGMDDQSGAPLGMGEETVQIQDGMRVIVESDGGVPT
jgi:hypothetical protein